MNPEIGRLMRRFVPAVLIGILVALACCTDNECYDNKSSLPYAAFYSSGNEPKAIALDSISILGVGAPGDSILHDSVNGLSRTYLPFRIDSGRTTYVIKYLNGEAGRLRLCDTITFGYEIVPWFVSEACGAIFEYDSLSVATTHVFIDSVVPLKRKIDNSEGVNIHIYFRTGGGEEEQ